jgi:NADPH2:quinone reductase
MLDRTRNFVTPRHHTMHVPRTMFAAAIDRFGGREVITPPALPVPAVDAGEVLIAVDTAAVGRWDADIREGYHAARKPHFPLVLGFDGSGVVAAAMKSVPTIGKTRRADFTRNMLRCPPTRPRRFLSD